MTPIRQYTRGVTVCTESLREFLTWEDLHFWLDINESWVLCLYHCLAHVRNSCTYAFHTLFLLNCPHYSEAVSGSPEADSAWWGYSWEPAWVEQVTVNHVHVSLALSQVCLHCAVERPSYSTSYIETNDHPSCRRSDIISLAHVNNPNTYLKVYVKSYT